MAPARQIVALLALIGAAFVLLACGSSDEPDLEGEPFSIQESEDLTGALSALQTAFDDRDCDEAQNKLAELEKAVDEMPEERDAELRSALNDGLDQLGGQIDEECQEESQTTSSTTSEEVVPPTTESVPTTTVEPTTTTEEEEEPTTTTDEEEPPGPPITPPGGGDDDGSGGTAPGGSFESERRGSSSSSEKPSKAPKPGKGAKVKAR